MAKAFLSFMGSGLFRYGISPIRGVTVLGRSTQRFVGLLDPVPMTAHPAGLDGFMISAVMVVLDGRFMSIRPGFRCSGVAPMMGMRACFSRSFPRFFVRMAVFSCGMMAMA
jgi:hypothetical protein